MYFISWHQFLWVTLLCISVSCCPMHRLTLSWRRPITYRNQPIDLQSKSMDWFLYDIGLCHEKIKAIQKLILNDPLSYFSEIVKIIKTLSFLCLKLVKKAKTTKILVFITFNHLIMIQYKISFKVRGHITIFGDDQVLTYWNIFPWGHGSQYLGFPTFWRGT